MNAHVYQPVLKPLKANLKFSMPNVKNLNLKVKMRMPVKSADLSKSPQKTHLRPLDYHPRRRVSQILIITDFEPKTKSIQFGLIWFNYCKWY